MVEHARAPGQGSDDSFIDRHLQHALLDTVRING